MPGDPPPNTLANRTHRRDKKRQEREPASAAEKALLRAEVAEEITAKRNAGLTPRARARASVWKSLWQQNSPRKVRAYLLKFAPEMRTPRLLLQLDVIIEQALLLRDLMKAHREQRDIHTEMGAALIALTTNVATALTNLPPPPPDASEIVTYLQSIEEILKRFDKLYTRFLAASPFLYVEKIENVIAKLLSLLKEAGLTTKGARMMQIDLEEELRQFEGLVSAEEAAAAGPVETNRERRARLIREAGGPVVAGDEKDDPSEEPEGEEEDDE